MNKKFTKTILSSAVAGLLLVSGGAMAQDNITIGNYTIELHDNGETAKIVKNGDTAGNGLQVNLNTGSITTVNKDELTKAIAGSTDQTEVQRIGESLRYTIDEPSLKKENIANITSEDLDKITANVEAVSNTITSKTAPAYNTAIKNGMSVDSALAVVKQDSAGGVLNEFNRLGTNVNSNSRQLQEHSVRLDDQQRQIDENHEEMKRAAAQSAALAGLFQPYSVGKFNATAALGGYSDKQAVAVGVGYRFNEQTAAKAAIAASDGDVSYNVGVNFEF